MCCLNRWTENVLSKAINVMCCLKQWVADVSFKLTHKVISAKIHKMHVILIQGNDGRVSCQRHVCKHWYWLCTDPALFIWGTFTLCMRTSIWANLSMSSIMRYMTFHIVHSISFCCISSEQLLKQSNKMPSNSCI